MPLHQSGIYVNISLAERQLSARRKQSITIVRPGETPGIKDEGPLRFMGGKYYVVKEQALPEVLLNVVKAKKLLDTGKTSSVNEACTMAGISRSSFYKYKEDIFEFHDNAEGRTINLSFQMEDEPGLLSDVLKIIALTGANILTIHQSIPISGVASLSLSIQVLDSTGDISEMISRLEEHEGVRNVKLQAGE